jgi:hypothetical protein
MPATLHWLQAGRPAANPAPRRLGAPGGGYLPDTGPAGQAGGGRGYWVNGARSTDADLPEPRRHRLQTAAPRGLRRGLSERSPARPSARAGHPTPRVILWRPPAIAILAVMAPAAVRIPPSTDVGPLIGVGHPAVLPDPPVAKHFLCHMRYLNPPLPDRRSSCPHPGAIEGAYRPITLCPAPPPDNNFSGQRRSRARRPCRDQLMLRLSFKPQVAEKKVFPLNS